MKILRYTEEVQKQLGSKTKPEPWLHVAIDMPKTQGAALYAIYVWDTREVVEEGDQMIWNPKDKREQINGTTAKDNHQPLVGLKRFANNLAFNLAATPQDQAAKIRAKARQLWEAYIDARDAYEQNMERKRQDVMLKQHTAMMRAIQKLADFGYKHNIPEWQPFDNRRGLFRGEEVPFPAILR